MYRIAPSILSANFAHLGEDIAIAEKSGADWIHIDVMDGHFVPNLTMGPVVVNACQQITRLPLDVHLMVEKPDHLFQAFAQAGANTLTVHQEACPHLHRSLQHIRSLGCKAGVALNPGTSAETIRPVLHMVDIVLVMSVNPGYSGQKFLPEVLPKIQQVRRWLDEVNPYAMIEVDGGITAETIQAVQQAGAQAFVAASAIFKNPSGIAAGVQALRNALPAFNN